MRLLYAVVFCMFFLAAREPASGQDRPIQLDTVSVEVNSRASPLAGAATRATEVIHANTIRNSPASTVAEVLQWAFGVDLMPRSAALADVAIRGSSFEQVLVLVDGVRMRDAQTGHFNLNLAVPLDQVERIEVLRGPASSLYGSDALGGVINIVTRRDAGQASVRLSRGSFATSDLAVSARQPIGRVVADVAAGFQNSDGHRTGTESEVGQGRLALAVPLAGEALFTEIGYARRDFGANGFYGNYPSFEATRTTTASARWRARRDSTTSLEPVVNFRRHSDDFILFRDDPDRYRNIHTTNQLGGELIGRSRLSSDVRVAAGLHANHDAIRSKALGNRSEWSAGASLELAVGEALGPSAVAGVRADRLASGDLAFSPSASAAWRPHPSIRLRSSAGRAFRAPTWTERYYSDPASEGNPDLEPEHAWTVDAGADVETAFGVRGSLTAYVRSATNLIDWARPSGDTTVPHVTRNVDSAEFRGLEAEIAFSPVADLDVAVRGSWLSLESSVADGYESRYALRPLAETTSLLVDRTFGLVRGGVRISRYRRVGDSDGAYTLADARASIDIGDVRVWTDLRNAFDTSYLDIVANPAPGRSLLVGVEWRQSR